MNTANKNFWVRVARACGPQVDPIFQIGSRILQERGPDDTYLCRTMFGAAWRMGLVQSIRLNFLCRKRHDPFADQTEHRDWWGSLALWKAAVKGWQLTAMNNPFTLSRFAKLCLALGEFARGAMDGVEERTPDELRSIRPLPPGKSFREAAEEVVRETLRNFFSDPEAGSPEALWGEMRDHLWNIYQGWQQQRTGLSARERRMLQAWVGLGFESLTDDPDDWGLGGEWGDYLLKVFPEQ